MDTAQELIQKKREDITLGTDKTVSTTLQAQAMTSGNKTTLTIKQIEIVETTLSITFATTRTDLDPILEQSSKMVIQEQSQKSTMNKSADLEWFASNPPELKPYANKFVAIRAKAIIGSGKTPDVAYKEAKKKIPDSDPLVIFVGESDYGL